MFLSIFSNYEIDLYLKPMKKIQDKWYNWLI